MSVATTPSSAFDLERPSSPLESAAKSSTNGYHDDDGLLVVAIHPEADDRRVVSNGAAGTLRAAVSVAVAAGNRRMWQDCENGSITSYPASELPEVVRSAAIACGITQVQVGPINHEDTTECVAIWFVEIEDPESATRRTKTVHLLTDATMRDIEFAEITAAAAAAQNPESPADAGVDADGYPPIIFDPSAPGTDTLTGLSDKASFENALDSYELDEATILFIDLDGFSTFVDTFGEDSAKLLLCETAARLRAVCRRDDIVAHIQADQFAILLDSTDRASALDVSKRVLSVIAEPLPARIAETGVTASVALAHEFGLLDMIELFESAGQAVVQSKRSGPGRVIIAA